MSRAAAIFDVDRTLIPDTSMERLLVPFLLRRRYLKTRDLARYLAYAARSIPAGETGSRSQNRYHLKDKDPWLLEELAAECFRKRILPLISLQGRREVERHQKEGRLVVLLSGTLMPLCRLLQDELGADVALAANLEVKEGALSGRLALPRPFGPEKARLVKNLARGRELDLAGSYAYGDHHSDMEVLALVGRPHAVNPDRRLRAAAAQRGWPILEFS